VIFQHDELEHAGRIGDTLRDEGHRLRVIKLYDGEAVPPDLDDVDGVISMGGTMDVGEEDKYPWMRSELDFIRQAVDAKLPFVGVCLGAQFLAAARGKSFSVHIWARFCQPTRIAYAADGDLRRQLVAALAQSVLLFHRRTSHLIAACDLAEFWRTGLRSTYDDEIRSEKPGRLRELFRASEDAYRARTRLALAITPEIARIEAGDRVTSNRSECRKRFYRLGLRLKRPFEKLAVLLRFIKAAFTFQGGLDYARWKIERHSGLRIGLTDRQRRHPLWGGLYLFVKILLRGGLR